MYSCSLLQSIPTNYKRKKNKKRKKTIAFKIESLHIQSPPVYRDVAIVELIALIMAFDSYYIFGGRLLAPPRQTEFHYTIQQCNVFVLKQLRIYLDCQSKVWNWMRYVFAVTNKSWWAVLLSTLNFERCLFVHLEIYFWIVFISVMPKLCSRSRYTNETVFFIIQKKCFTKSYGYTG